MTKSHWQTFHRTFLIAGLALFVLQGCDDGESGLVVTGEYPVIWVERAIPRDEDTGEVLPDNLRDPGEFRPGARLMFKRRAAPAAPSFDITTRLFADGERYDVRDVSPSWDGKKILYALRGPYIDNAQEEDQPTWNIWEYDIEANASRRVIASSLIAEEGHDIMPAYLPDGRIVFSSTRQRASRAVLVDENKPQFAMLDDTRQNEVYMLHVMENDGSNLHQISFNAAHDLYPTVLSNGRVLFARQVQVGGRVAMHLYSMRPDGRDVAPAFGGNSHRTAPNRADQQQQVQFAKPRLMDDGRVLVIERPYETDFFGGALSAINIDEFSDASRRIDGSVDSGGLSAIDMDGFSGERLPSRAGRYADAVPLGDGTGRLLVSWSSCRLETVADVPARTVPCAGNDIEDTPAFHAQWREALPIYGIFVLDIADGSRLPVVVPKEDTVYEHVAVVTPRPLATYLPDAQPGVDVDSDWFDEGVGVLDIRSVYDLDGTYSALGGTRLSIAALANPMTTDASQRPARWLRLEKIVAIPDRDVRDFRQTAFGVNAGNGMREILGYTPIEPDGSVRVKVPANVPFTFSILDRNGQRMSARHGAWLQLVPGEERRCAGCHSPLSDAPHGRNDSGIAPLYAGAAGGAPYLNTDPAKIANAGETMAQVRARLDADTLAPSMDVIYTDVWTDAARRAPDASLAWLYADLLTPPPTSAACQATWAPLCRTTIHYEAHIHPLWSRDRRVFDTDGVTELANHTCTQSGCHSSRNTLDEVVLPAVQLDLRDGYSGEVVDHMNAYRELLATDNRQILDAETQTLVDELVPARDNGGNIIYQTNPDGSFVLDINGQRVPVLVTVPLQASLAAGNARGSTRFFNVFRIGSHAGWLTPAELRLISEWVDLGAQYFNDPFAAPLD